MVLVWNSVKPGCGVWGKGKLGDGCGVGGPEGGAVGASKGRRACLSKRDSGWRRGWGP